MSQQVWPPPSEVDSLRPHGGAVAVPSSFTAPSVPHHSTTDGVSSFFFIPGVFWEMKSLFPNVLTVQVQMQ